MEFHKTERGVATAYATQVRKPLYGSSVGSSDLYRPYLGPLIDALALQGAASGVSNLHDR